jgi:signal transduction histidine kinase
MLGRVSIRTKLILGFVLGITFSAVVGLVAVDKLRTVGRLATDLYDKPLQSVDFGRVAQIDFRDLASARRLASVPDPMLAGEAQTEYHRARRVLDEDLRVAMRRAASPPVAARLTRVLGQLEQWDRLVPPDLISATDEAAIETLARDIQAEIDRAVEDAKADGFAFVENARQVAADARSTTLIMSLMLIMGGIAISVVLAADIIRPLRTAVAVSESIAGGDLDRAVTVSRTDEAGKVLRAMELMRQKLRGRLEADRQRAEDEIRLERERTGIMAGLARTAALAQKRAEQALEDLRTTQAQLIEAEKMASLGGLVAGVSHEINTPLGNALGASTHLVHRTRAARSLIETGKLRKSDAEAYFSVADEAAEIVNSNLERASELIHSFKQVAVDQVSDLCRRFDLAVYIDDVLTSLKPRLKKVPHRVTVACPAGLELDQFAGGLAQVLTNLIINALVHAFDHVAAGTVAISAREKVPGTVELVVADDGCGIAPETIGHIFEPFFTTRRGSGGSGLGLHIVFNIVTQRLGGTISVNSTVGAGTRFVLVFPRIASASTGATGNGMSDQRSG